MFAVNYTNNELKQPLTKLHHAEFYSFGVQITRLTGIIKKV